MSKKYSKEAQTNFCMRWLSSGQSKKEFCQENNISKSALHKWLKKLDKISTKKSSLKLLPLDESGIEKKTELEILLPKGILIRGSNEALKDLVLELSK